MSERRYIVTIDRNRLGSTSRPPTRRAAPDRGGCVFWSDQTWEDGRPRRIGNFAHETRADVVLQTYGLVARETDDPDLVKQIDDARRAVEAAREAHRAANAAEQEVLALVAARCKPARLP